MDLGNKIIVEVKDEGFDASPLQEEAKFIGDNYTIIDTPNSNLKK